MISFKKATKTHLMDHDGFTLMELMVVIAIIAVLASFAIFNYIPLRAKSMDSVAHSDARNIVASIINAVTVDADVDFTQGTALLGAPGAIGEFDSTGMVARTPVFVLSPGVEARITGGSSYLGTNNIVFSAFIYHTGGSFDPSTNSGKKEYFCFVDADAGVSSAPLY